MALLTLLQAAAPAFRFSGMLLILLIALVILVVIVFINRSYKSRAASSGITVARGVSPRYPALKVLCGLFRIIGTLLILADLFLLGKVITSGQESLYWLGALGLASFYTLASFTAAEFMVLLSDISVSASNIQSLLEGKSKE